MKILFLHTYYLQKGGEDAVFEQDYELITNSGEARRIRFKNKPGWRGGLQFLLSIWNIFAARKLKEEISANRPDIIHLHNLHFAIGPIAIRVAKKAGIPVIITLHNYRLLNPSGILDPGKKAMSMSQNEAFPWKEIRNKAYRNSSLQTFWLAFIIWFHNKIGTWKMPDLYIVQTEFAKNIFTQSYLDLNSSKFKVNPNFVHPPDIAVKEKKKHFLFVGRLSEEKGIHLLLQAFEKTGFNLQIAGDGPLVNMVDDFCKINSNVKYLGRLDKAGVQEAMAQCTALVFPSIWYEGMPITILEAFSLGVPVIASNDGAMSVMIQHGHNGLLFDMGNPKALLTQIECWQAMDQKEQNSYYRNAREIFDEKYSPAQYKYNMQRIYEDIIEE